jgi:hypothetical protein
LDSYFIPYNKGDGTVVDWDFQSVIHCLSWHNIEGYSVTSLYLGGGRKNGKFKNIKMHRLILKFPPEVDHINGRKNDNRYKNLRSVTHRENTQNKICHRNGRLVGTYKYKKNKWAARIQINGKRKSLGLFNTEQEAHESYIREVNKLKE